MGESQWKCREAKLDEIKPCPLRANACACQTFHPSFGNPNSRAVLQEFVLVDVLCIGFVTALSSAMLGPTTPVRVTFQERRNSS